MPSQCPTPAGIVRGREIYLGPKWRSLIKRPQRQSRCRICHSNANARSIAHSRASGSRKRAGCRERAGSVHRLAFGDGIVALRVEHETRKVEPRYNARSCRWHVLTLAGTI
jgi:hypothetical protein